MLTRGTDAFQKKNDLLEAIKIITHSINTHGVIVCRNPGHKLQTIKTTFVFSIPYSFIRVKPTKSNNDSECKIKSASTTLSNCMFYLFWSPLQQKLTTLVWCRCTCGCNSWLWAQTRCRGPTRACGPARWRGAAEPPGCLWRSGNGRCVPGERSVRTTGRGERQQIQITEKYCRLTMHTHQNRD